MRLALPKLRSSFVGAVLSVGSLVISLLVLSQHFEGSWGGFFIFVMDLPISWPVMLFGYWLGIDQIPLIIVAGAVQWYLLGAWIEHALTGSNSKLP